MCTSKYHSDMERERGCSDDLVSTYQVQQEKSGIETQVSVMRMYSIQLLLLRCSLEIN